MALLWRASALAIVFSAAGLAQFPVHENDAQKAERALIEGLKGDALKCDITPMKPFVDFALRFEAGYVVQCPIEQFDGRETPLSTLIRVQPEAASPVVLVDYGRVPALPPQLEGRVNLRHLHNLAEFSGVFAVGEGDYPVDVVISDDRHRTAHKHWTVHAKLHGKEQKISVGLPSNTARSVALSPWSGKDNSMSAGLHLTVLLDAAPINPSDSKLRAWDRAFLLGALASLVREVNCASIKLVAFNLDQNREIFRQDNFNRAGFRRLAHSLQELELGTVSYRVLQSQAAAAELPLKLVRDEGSAQQPSSDAVIFLGPNARMRDKVMKESLQVPDWLRARIFYFEYFPVPGSEFPDGIHNLTSALNGTILKLHSPGDLADGIVKMQRRLQGNGVASVCPAGVSNSPE